MIDDHKAIALFSPDGRAWSDGQPIVWQPDAAVSKIVIGSLERPDEGEAKSEKRRRVKLPSSLADLYPNLTHLHLWGLESIETLPALPRGLRCLDVRRCERLRALPELPAGLDTLVLDDNPQLPSPDRSEFPELVDLSVNGCAGMQETWLHAVLRDCPQLYRLEARGWTQLTEIKEWAPRLVDIRLDGCSNLEALPDEWPPALRRIGLRDAERLQSLPDFGDTLDYIDLARTRSLRMLPTKRGRPRTLFLHGSGVLAPPASEHGASADENVASATEAYFEDIAMVGPGQVKRCKLLVLGNGGAGKTCLSLFLTGRDPQSAAKLGTTHGVQFWDWERFNARVGSTNTPVHLHVWDFGGQEIYHNTHRLFITAGAVFVVAWNPEQDGRQPDAAPGEYVDAWRPLRYWLDFIRMSCTHAPRIAVVISHRTAGTPALSARLEEELAGYSDVEMCFVDSWNQQGEKQKLERWLRGAVGGVIEAQGQAVPSYWEIAQDMVERWVRQRQSSDVAAAGPHMTAEAFSSELRRAIEHRLADGGANVFPQLRQALQSGEFELNEDGFRRTLGFLTHSGWIYWKPGLFGDRVIVGQKWALDGLYAILDRRAASPVFKALTRSRGAFTRSDLEVWAWQDYSRDEQELLISYMKECMLCFQLRPAEDAWREEAVYQSFEHLPASDSIPKRFVRPAAQTVVGSPKLHKLHWQHLLMSAGAKFGKDAEYYANQLLVKSAAGYEVLLNFLPSDNGLGGQIDISVVGAGAAERLQEIRSFAATYLPESDVSPADPQGVVGEVRSREAVFISYAWNSTDEPKVDYEEPVDALVEFLRKQGYVPADADRPDEVQMRLLRDRDSMERYETITSFMERGSRCPAVVVVHSERYWRSPNCMAELILIDEDLKKTSGKSLRVNVIPLSHPTSRVTGDEGFLAYKEHWRTVNIPRRFPDANGLRDKAIAALNTWSQDLSDEKDFNVPWDGVKSRVLAEVEKRLRTALKSQDTVRSVTQPRRR